MAKKPIIQRHHIEYQEGNFEDKKGKVVWIFKGEHMIITRMQWRKQISKGFIEALEFWLTQNKEKAVDLSKNRVL